MLQVHMDRLPDNVKSRIERAETFSEALDVLMEITGEIGFTQVLYAYIPLRPQLPTGEWLPLKLNVRSFPRDWERGWTQYMTVDPYYRACFNGTLPIDWTDVQRSPALSAPQKEACTYLGDFGLSRGTTIPVHLPFGRFAVMSAIVDRSCANWDEIRDNTQESLFRLMHIFTKFIHDRHLEGQIETVPCTRLTPRELECLRWASARKKLCACT
jgi:LuxR family transcriptional regulator, quorum-sensing system regulator SdiA